jgi:hypothetical protein
MFSGYKNAIATGPGRKDSCIAAGTGEYPQNSVTGILMDYSPAGYGRVGIPGEVTRWWARCVCHKEVIHPPDPLALAGTISRGGQQEKDGVGRAGTGARTRFSPPDHAGGPISGH